MPTTDLRHIVEVVAFVRSSDGSVLLIRVPRRGWRLPVGRLERGEMIGDALKREVAKFFGGAIEVQNLAGIFQDPRQSILTLGLVCRAADGGVITNASAVMAGWFSISQAEQMITDPAARRQFGHLRSNRSGLAYRSFGPTTFAQLMAVEL